MKPLNILFLALLASVSLSSCELMFPVYKTVVGEGWEIKDYLINFGDGLKSTGLELEGLVFSHGIKESDKVEYDELAKGQGYVWGDGNEKRYETYKVTGSLMRIDTRGFVPMVYVAGNWEIIQEASNVVVLKDAYRTQKKLKEGEYEWIRLVRMKFM